MGMRRDLFLPGHFMTEEVRVRKTSASLCNIVARGAQTWREEPQQNTLCFLSAPGIKFQKRKSSSFWHAEEAGVFRGYTKRLAVHSDKKTSTYKDK